MRVLYHLFGFCGIRNTNTSSSNLLMVLVLLFNKFLSSYKTEKMTHCTEYSVCL
jgi:hypothetical protein